MKKLFLVLVALSALMAACASPSALAPAGGAAIAASTTVAPATPEIKENFVATDPSTVNLSLGRPQLVEFFAFW